MHNYEHKKLIDAITKLDEMPLDSHAFSNWIQAEAHLAFLQGNALADELIIFASGEYTFVHSVVVSNTSLSPINQADLMNWSLNPYNSIASYVMGGERDNVWIERGLRDSSSETLDNSVQLIFGRTFDGWAGQERNYYELNQEYSHLTEIHWRPERRAYCRFNEHGDLESVVSITTREDRGSNVTLVSFKWKPLEEYLVASDASLVRMFDFTLFRKSGFNGWSNESPQNFYDLEHFFYQQQVMPGYAAWTRGVQIIRPRCPEKAVFTNMRDGWSGKKNKAYVEFIALDWRNNHTAKISTDPRATTNYFNAGDNSLPFEVSPAFFRPEVLLKYKADRDKYRVGERDISCRSAWHLEAIDVNEAGQVHAYIRYLRRLPYEEQLHWLSFNELPKASISKRAFLNDFEGKWVTFMEPLQKVLSIIRCWHNDKVIWWTLRDEKLLDQVNTPLTESRDEWAEAFMDLAKLVIEGFETKPIRAKLDTDQIQYQNDDKTIALLEKLLNKGSASDSGQKLIGLRTVQLLRSKAKGHVGGNEAERLAQNALMEHETFGNHFRFVCTQVADELETIQQLLA